MVSLKTLGSLGFVGRLGRPALLLGVILGSSSCAHQYVEELADVNEMSERFAIETETDIADCRASLARDHVGEISELDADRIRLVNWNIRKNSHENWKDDFDSLIDEKDLVLIQEAAHGNYDDQQQHQSFAAGYRTKKDLTGVLTLSRIKPLTQCSFVTLEPLLRSPKATSLTEYGLSGTDETLIVVNVHAVNFSMGTGAYREQFSEIFDTLWDHSGPIILSGDFNTWRNGRTEVVEKLALELGLDPVSFDDDVRVKTFGKPLDHIYVRGLDAREANTTEVETSDHNPMSATFSMP